MSQCGTYSGAQAHQKNGEELCEECRQARNAYMRNHRSENNSATRAANNARSRALWRLADRYRDEFNQLVREERRK